MNVKKSVVTDNFIKDHKGKRDAQLKLNNIISNSQSIKIYFRLFIENNTNWISKRFSESEMKNVLKSRK